MEVDRPEDVSGAANATRCIVAVVDDEHPFDLDGYISNYSGRTVIDRLIHIVSVCPTIAPEAFQLCVQHIHQSRDPTLYQTLLQAYEHVASTTTTTTATTDGGGGGGETAPPLPNPLELAELDMKWADEVLVKSAAERTKLELELKTYSNNMIKESIRMAHRDLAGFYLTTGEYSSALKHYTKSREFCTTGQHVLEMCMSILELLIEQRNYPSLSTYVFKADAALDATAAAANNNNNNNNNNAAPASSTSPSASTAPQLAASLSISKKRSTERDNVQSKLDLAAALSHLGQGNYEKAAHAFLKIGNIKELGDWVGRLIAPGDVAIYGTLCALASFQRSAIKSKILENSAFAAYLEQEPYVRELIESYMNSNFMNVLAILNRYSTRHLIDVHLSAHVHDLTNAIRSWAVIFYFQPFAAIKLDRMSAAFGWTVDEVERQVVNLIQSGGIQGRVDSQNKILHAKKTDYRAELFARTISAGQEIQATNRKLLLRLKLQQSDLIVKSPKGHLSTMEFDS